MPPPPEARSPPPKLCLQALIFGEELVDHSVCSREFFLELVAALQSVDDLAVGRAVVIRGFLLELIAEPLRHAYNKLVFCVFAADRSNVLHVVLLQIAQ